MESLVILDMFVPIYDDRLDFLIIEAKRINQGKPIKKGQEVFLGYTLLNPTRPGLVDSHIIITAVAVGNHQQQQQHTNTNKTYRIEIPIIATVMGPRTPILVNSLS